jgi:hypothetical protein
MKVTLKRIQQFMMFKLPSAYLCGVRLIAVDNSKAVVNVKYRWINQNPFNSMYFAVQSMAAELSTGAIVLKKIKECHKEVSMLVSSHTGSFSKKAVGKITFTCNDGALIDEALKRALETGEGQLVVMKSVGMNESGEQVSSYSFEWSIKVKS